ncbi:3-hydroxyacyl-CoA dehydrogenase family protein [Chitinophaga japonensis]|uniref:3-hydroxybutyryl-CoA dehydrogenase n=1 Tax=Chitinophaga japonensis TaxID=104662 RepID=A0A562TG63_CHIJA|nr:3-hydroxyacyl-CoA dehydrogenase family protein [Chitinophaga japonensis]TWI91930.1 3-hydroxybutyryl-CoA dehydrogenase [Chitinophaga japonensis]
MNILVVGDDNRYRELQQKGLDGHHVRRVRHPEEAILPGTFDLVIDLVLDDAPDHAAVYARVPSVPVLAGLAKSSLSELMHRHAFSQGFNIMACNWLPGFIARPITETAVLDEEQQPMLDRLMQQLGWQYALVQDAVGMVTPRVVCMIINEAYFTVEAGTAAREDIDIAMRLGTNYPHGPFEWAQQIGIKHVYDVLSAVYKATGDERYRVCELLREEAHQ